MQNILVHSNAGTNHYQTDKVQCITVSASLLIMFRNSQVVFHINHCLDPQKVRSEIYLLNENG